MLHSRAVEHEAALNMDPGALSPYNIIDEYQRLASAIALNTHAPPNTRVSEDGMKISFHASTIDISDWRSGITTLIAQTTIMIEELCYGGNFGLKVPEKVVDDWTDIARGYSWVKNAKFVPDSLALLGALLKDSVLNLATTQPDGSLEFNTAAVWKVIERCNIINDNLALLCFFLNGQTPRVAEFIDHKYSNSTRPRTMFYDDHSASIWMVIRRLKTENLTGSENFVPMKCPPVLSDLLIRFYTIIRPVEAALVYELKGHNAATIYDEFMWARDCKRTDPEHLYKIIPEFLEKLCHSKINVHDWRQISVEIGRVFLGSEHEIRQEEGDTLSGQRGHSENMGRFKYALEASHLPTLSSDLLLRYGRASEKHWSVAGVVVGEPPMIPLATRQKLSLQASTASGTGTAPVSDFNSAALMISIQAMVADLVRKNTETVRQVVQETMAEALATAQMKMARPTGNPEIRPPVVIPPIPSPDPDRSEFDDIYDDNDVTMNAPENSGAPAHTHPISVNLLQLLQLQFPKIANPRFKSPHQQKVVEMSLARSENFIAVLPTGGGKSLAFTLPPLVEDDLTTYVVVPNKALLEDHLIRCKKLGIQASRWTSGSRTENDLGHIKFLAVESAVCSAFARQVPFSFVITTIFMTLGFRYWHASKDTSARIVYDEAHLILTSQAYRTSFYKFHNLAGFPAQKIALTATLPIRLESELRIALGFPHDVPIIRAPTDQPQVGYHRFVVERSSTTGVRLAVDAAKTMERFMDPDQIGIIYGTSIAEVEAISKAFTHCRSHSMMDSSDKSHDEALWKSGERRWIAATTGLIHGIDAPNVGCTIFLDLPFGLINLYQGSGRGGRDGRFSYSIIICYATNQYLPPHDEDLNCQLEADKWAKAPDECLRLELSVTLDGRRTTCLDLPGCNLCSFCTQSMDIHNAISQILRDPPTALPTQALQPALAAQPQIADHSMSFEDDDFYDLGLQDIIGLDFDGIEALAFPAPAHSTSDGRPVAPFPSVHTPYSHPAQSSLSSTTITLPVQNIPSLSIQRDVAYYHQTRRTKEAKYKTLDRLTAKLLGHCPICWAYRRTLHAKHDKNVFRDCKGTPGFVAFMNGWIDFKKMIRFQEKYAVCYKCQLPQGKYLVTAHPNMDRGLVGQRCPFDNLVVQLVWLIRHERPLWDSARLAFPTLPANPLGSEFAAWIVKIESIENFYNGLEMVLWFLVQSDL